MDQDAKAKFILALHKHSLQAFASGGDVQASQANNGQNIGSSFGSIPGGNLAGQEEHKYLGVNDPVGNAIGSGAQTVVNEGANVGQQAAQGAGGFMQGIAGAFTAQNNYNAQLAPTDNFNYNPIIGQSAGNSFSGFDRSVDLQNQQQALANQLQAQTQGLGPNPAQSALNQATGQNVATQAALMASQRGAGANPGMIARQAGMQGAATQQQAAGQGATMQAQQQLAAQQQLGAQQAAMNQANIGEQGINNQLFNSAAGAQNTQNSNQIQNYNMAQGINSQVSQNNADATNKTMSGMMGGAGSVLSMLSKGGLVDHPHLHEVAKIYHPHMFADGGGVSASIQVPEIKDTENTGSSSGGGGGSSGGGGIAALLPLLALASTGGKVAGKAKVKGNSQKNDNVPALLSPGEIVIPRSITALPDAPAKAAAFVQAAINKKKMGKK